MNIQTNAPASIINRQAFNNAIAKIGTIVEKRNTIPILSNVHIKASSDKSVIIRATNLDMESAIEIRGAYVHPELDTTLPAHTLAKLCKAAAPSDSVTISNGIEAAVCVGFGGLQTTIGSLPAADFPDLAKRKYSHTFTLPAADFLTVLNKVTFAISTEETRYYLNGIYMALNNHLTFVASDGHRLARYELDKPAGLVGMPGAILPRQLTAVLAKRLKAKDAPDEITIRVARTGEEENWHVKGVQIEIGAETITAKVIDGTYPDYTRVIPTENHKPLRVDAKEFTAAIKQVSIISSDRGRAMKVEIRQDKLHLTVNHPDTGHAEIDVPAEYSANTDDDECHEFGVNTQYMIDCLSHVEEPVIRLGGVHAPIRIEDGADDRLTLVLMPMRV